MTEPDELYTLRAQFWLGHYQLALEEAKQIVRRPMKPALKAEREEFIQRCYIAMGQSDKVISGDTPGLQALALKAQFESAASDAQKQAIVQQLQPLLSTAGGDDASVQLTASHIYLAAGMKKEALQCVHAGATMEHISTALQIYLQLDRLDLAQKQLQMMKRTDEESVLTQLSSVHISLATGSSAGQEAIHTLSQLSEQYGPSIFLLNLMACAYLQLGQYAQAESKLEQARSEFGANDVNTLVNLIVAYQYQQKATAQLVQALRTQFPSHFMAQGLEMVIGAFERESVKYQVS